MPSPECVQVRVLLAPHAGPAGVAATGLVVRSGHMNKGGSRELYDFKLHCGEQGALTGWAGLRFDTKATAHGAGVCPEEENLSGVQVLRGRGDGHDYYTFKLRCGRAWRKVVGLPFDALRETRSATCSKNSHVIGVRVHRGFQDWGSIDTYEFQLKCEDTESLEERRQQGVVATALADLLATLGGDEAWQAVSATLTSDSGRDAARSDSRRRQVRSEL